jgi:hypothetical protein
MTARWRWARAAGPGRPAAGAAGARRPLLLLGVVVAGLLAMRAAAPFLAPPAGVPATAAPVAVAATRPVLLAEATGTSLFLDGDDGLLRVDLDRGRVRRVALPGGAAAGDRGLVERDGVVVAVRGGFAYAAAGRDDLPATPLGPASYALASARPGRVWLVQETGDPGRWFRVREVALAPSPATPAAGWSRAASPSPASPGARGTLPLGRRPVAGTAGGLLVHVVGPAGGLAVWDPRTGRLGRRLAAGTPLAVVAARGRAVAWVEGSALHLGDLASGRDRVVPPPPGSDGFAAPGAFSPDGRTLAAITRVGFSTRPALALVAVERAAAVRVTGSEGALSDRCSPCLAWAPAGDWVFFSRLGPGFAVGAYRLGRPQAVTVPVEVPGSFPPSFATTRPE